MGRKFKKLVSHKKKLSTDPEEKAFVKKYMNFETFVNFQ